MADTRFESTPPDTSTDEGRPGIPPQGGPQAEGPRHRSRAWIAGVLVVVLAGTFAGFKLTTGTKKPASATTAQSPSGAAARGGLVGTLASISGDTLIVTTQSGVKTTVHTSSATVFTASVAGSITDVKVGDQVSAIGTSAGTDHITAQRVTDTGTTASGGPGGGQGPGNGTPPNRPAGATRSPGSFAAGTVTSVSGSTLTLKSTSGTMTTVDTGSATFSVVNTVSLQDLRTGVNVSVSGPVANDGSVTATAVRQGGRGGFGPGGGAPGGANGAGS